MSWCTDAPEDEAISLFAGLLVNPDVPLSLQWIDHSVSLCTSSLRHHQLVTAGLRYVYSACVVGQVSGFEFLH